MESGICQDPPMNSPLPCHEFIPPTESSINPPPQSIKFNNLDRVVMDSQQSFRRVGAALAEIKEERLWNAVVDTWTKYCRLRGCTIQHANRLIHAARVDAVIREAAKEESIGEIPQNEWQMRPLLGDLTDDQRIKSWKLAIEIASPYNPVQKDVKAAVNQILGETTEDKPNKREALRILVERLHAYMLDREQGQESVPFAEIEVCFAKIKAAI